MSKPPLVDRVARRARLVYRIDGVNYFRCLGCGHLSTASQIGRHVERCFAKPGAPKDSDDAARSTRLPYRDD